MIEKTYYVEDAESPKVKNRYLIRFDRDDDLKVGRTYRYDWKNGGWVLDREMLKIFDGGIPVTVISEKEAEKLIKGYGK